MSSEQCVIEAHDLTVGYGNKKVISNINIEARKGQMVCLLGPNGAGKTTLLRTISGHLNPVEGEILLYGKEINKTKKKDLAKKISVVLTERINPDLVTVYQIVSLGRHPHTNFWGNFTAQDKEIIEDSLKLVNAQHLKGRYYSTLSDGEKQKVMIARALAQKPEVMVLDEPTSHLDVKHKVDVLSILRKMSRDKGITTIISLHDVDLALKTCDVIILVKNGIITDWGTPDEIIKSDTISDLYDIESAGYNNTLGCLELLCPQESDVFIIAGEGTGIPIYRLLLKHNIGFSTGILQENDIDTYISCTMKAKSVILKDQKDSKDAVLQGQRIIDKCSTVIQASIEDCTNKPYNHFLLQYAMEQKKEIVYLHQKGKNTDIEKKLTSLLKRTSYIN